VKIQVDVNVIPQRRGSCSSRRNDDLQVAPQGVLSVLIGRTDIRHPAKSVSNESVGTRLCKRVLLNSRRSNIHDRTRVLGWRNVAPTRRPAEVVDLNGVGRSVCTWHSTKGQVGDLTTLNANRRVTLHNGPGRDDKLNAGIPIELELPDIVVKRGIGATDDVAQARNGEDKVVVSGGILNLEFTSVVNVLKSTEVVLGEPGVQGPIDLSLVGEPRTAPAELFGGTATPQAQWHAAVAAGTPIQATIRRMTRHACLVRAIQRRSLFVKTTRCILSCHAADSCCTLLQVAVSAGAAVKKTRHGTSGRCKRHGRTNGFQRTFAGMNRNQRAGR